MDEGCGWFLMPETAAPAQKYLEPAKPPSGAGGNDAIAGARVSMAFITQLIHRPGP
jgi:hypothetical protein